MSIINFSPFPHLKTSRFNLRPLGLNDADEIFQLRTDDRVNQYLDRPRAKTIEDARTFIQKIRENVQANRSIFWAISSQTDVRLIGSICLWNISKEEHKGEIGYELIPDYQGMGIMQEVMPAVIRYGFEQMKLQTIEAVLHPGNIKSIKLLEKFGFTVETDAEKQVEGMLVYLLRRPESFSTI